MKIRTEPLRELSVTRFTRLRSVIDMNPAYQREGGVWKEETRSRLIDSILNGLDVPKLYFEVPTTKHRNDQGLTVQYAVIDGKQRLEAITAFLDGELGLADDFWFFEDEDVRAGGMTLQDLRASYPNLAQRFLDYELPVVRVNTDSVDLIEEMFQRLNASSALNAAERRNAVSGATRDAANELAEHELLVRRSPIRSARYKYRELGAKFLAIEHQTATRNRIVDTKAATLYDLFVATHGANPSLSPSTMKQYRDQATATLDRMSSVFETDDPLLASIGTVVVYYIVFRETTAMASATRAKLLQFEELRREASRMPEDDSGYSRPANGRLREYNVFVQSTNDGRALERRAEILSAFVTGHAQSDPLAGLDQLDDVDPPEHDDVEE
ncbi:DUF262 domain-containing protein [Pedococcus sp. NPDC057267]|uniref:DUF262 domain-containing protein n=1 Tax=Pedococcus sp. NPDC057267 TaxID=3346077 RepID=UPI003641058C